VFTLIFDSKDTDMARPKKTVTVHPPRRPLNDPSPQRLAKYNITRDEYMVMYHGQGGICAICLKRPANAIDHCHKTKKVRALLCGPCNTSIGMLKESQSTLVRAIVYLQQGHNLQKVPLQYGHATSPYRKPWGFRAVHNDHMDSDMLSIYQGDEHIADIDIFVPCALGATAEIEIRRYRSLADLPVRDLGCTLDWVEVSDDDDRPETFTDEHDTQLTNDNDKDKE
jgi:hypothetical protein